MLKIVSANVPDLFVFPLIEWITVIDLVSYNSVSTGNGSPADIVSNMDSQRVLLCGELPTALIRFTI